MNQFHEPSPRDSGMSSAAPQACLRPSSLWPAAASPGAPCLRAPRGPAAAGSYSNTNRIASARSRPSISPASQSARSMPADTPAAVTILPERTTRSTRIGLGLPDDPRTPASRTSATRPVPLQESRRAQDQRTGDYRRSPDRGRVHLAHPPDFVIDHYRGSGAASRDQQQVRHGSGGHRVRGSEAQHATFGHHRPFLFAHEPTRPGTCGGKYFPRSYCIQRSHTRIQKYGYLKRINSSMSHA